MTLGELLKILRGSVLRDKSDQVAGSASDQLWTDEELVTYIAKAQDKFASLTQCIRDSTTNDVCNVRVTAGKNTFMLHPKVTAEISVRAPSDNADLARAGHDAFNNYHRPDPYYPDLSKLEEMRPGKPIAYSTDEGMASDEHGSFNAMEFRTYPDVGTGFDATIRLRVNRLPLQHLSLENPGMRLEIPEPYHMDILDWAGYLALRGPDLDVAGGDGFNRAMSLRGSFMSTVEDCKRDMKRRMFTPIQWGFGRNGFSWERD